MDSNPSKGNSNLGVAEYKDITVLQSDQPGHSLTDSPLQQITAEHLPHQAHTGEEKEFRHTADNTKHCWYIAHNSRDKRSVKELYEELKAKFDTDELYWPMHTVERLGKRIIAPIIPQYLFIHTTHEVIHSIFQNREVNRLGYLLKKRISTEFTDYQTVSEREMSRLKWYCDNNHESLQVLNKSLSELRDKMRVRIIEGELAGTEGVITRNKGNRSFVFMVGEMAVVVNDVFKKNLEVIDDDKKSKTAHSINSHIAILQDRLRQIKTDKGYIYQNTSAEKLSDIILQNIYHSPLLSPEHIKRFMWISEEKVSQETDNCRRRQKNVYGLRKECDIFHNLSEISQIKSRLSGKDLARIDVITEHIIANHERQITTKELPDLSPLFFQGSISPLLTPCYPEFDEQCDVSDSLIVKHDGFLELIRKVTLTESQFNTSKQTYERVQADYLAHIALMQASDGIQAITNWSSCADACCEAYDTNLRYIPTLQEILEASTPISFRNTKTSTSSYPTHTESQAALDISGLSLTIPDLEIPTNVPLSKERKTILITMLSPSLTPLITTAVSLCQEIWSSTHPTIRKHLPKVWVKTTQ